MGGKKATTRRKFLVGSLAGVGVILGGGYLSRGMARRYMAGYLDSLDAPYVNQAGPNAWFEITADGMVTLLSPKVEMGQGVFTGLAQIAAEELEVAVERIQVVHAPTSTGNIDPRSTGGSDSISSLWDPLRELAATMREMLKTEAATLMGTSVAALKVSDGVISAGEQAMTYGEVVAQVKEWTVPGDPPPLKDASAYRYVGRPIPRLDLRDKVLGAPIFGFDASMPDMLFGAVVRPDRIGAKFVSADASAARGMPGVVEIVEEDDFVGVVATSLPEAERAKQAIRVEWAVERTWQQADIEAMIEVGRGEDVEIQKQGDADDLLADGPGVIRAEYRSPIGAHAQVEPNGSVAHVESDRAVVMISTQVARITRKEVADRLGLDPDQVDIQPTFLGGGFGRRLHTPNAMQAAVLSKAVGKPVKCFYDRIEEFQNDTFRPPTHHILKAKLSGDGRIEAMSHDLSSGDVMFGSPMFPGMLDTVLGADLGAWRGGMIQYRAIPNHRVASWRVKLPFATSWWRSLGLLANTFAIESFVDELATQAGKDPVQFRLDHIQDDEAGRRLRAVIESAAEKAGWPDRVGEGRMMGFAASTDTGTPVAQVAEVSVEDGDDGPEIKVHKVTCAIDPGLAINPDQIRAQCEGAIIMGQSAAMYEEMTVQDGQLTPTMYGGYRMALMKDAPREIDVVILENAAAPGGVGEPPLGPIGAAIGNAVFRLTGQRLRSMPLRLGKD